MTIFGTVFFLKLISYGNQIELQWRLVLAKIMNSFKVQAVLELISAIRKGSGSHSSLLTNRLTILIADPKPTL